MADCSACCTILERQRPQLLSLEKYRILFESEALCIARCEACGGWLANEGDGWEPLFSLENSVRKHQTG